MATITSAQTGWWGDPNTWVGGVVPDMSVDDAIIAQNHGVLIEPESYIVLVDGQNLTVEDGGALVVIGGLEVFFYGSLYLDGDLIIVSGGYVSLYDDGYADLNSGAAASVDGYLDLAYYSYLNVYGEITVGYRTRSHRAEAEIKAHSILGLSTRSRCYGAVTCAKSAKSRWTPSRKPDS